MSMVSSYLQTELCPQLALSLFVENEFSLRQQLDSLILVVGTIELRLDNAPKQLELNSIIAGYSQFNFILCNRAAPQQDYSVEPGPRVYVDWPIDSELPESLQKFQVVHSWHAHDAQSDYDLPAIAAKLIAARRNQDLCKMVQWCDCVEDFELYADIDLCFAQGAASQFSRIVSLINEAPFMYVCLPQLQTAVGQFDLPTAVERFASGIGPQTALCGVVGDKHVLSSQSPQLWHAAMAESQPDQQFAYLPLPVADPSRFEEIITACQFRALSVTTPHKKWAEQFALVASGFGAANFLLASGESYHAFSTDGVGALQALANHSFTPEHKLLVLGNGGAAQSVVQFALQNGVEVAVAARRPHLSADWQCPNYSLDDISLDEYDAFIQATTLGSEQQPGCILPNMNLPNGSLALDMVYRPAETEWLLKADAAGATIVTGVEMLVEQFQAQFELFNAKPPLVLIGMRGAGKSSLGESLAAELQLQFLDTDSLLEQQYQRDISEWLRADPKSFRDCEVEMLAAALQAPNCVIATGGGVVETSDGRDLLQQCLNVLWLKCDTETLIERQKLNPRAPLTEVSLAEEVCMLDERRRGWYLKCSKHQIDSSISIADSLQHAIDFYIN
jgi:shikimate kinase